MDEFEHRMSKGNKDISEYIHSNSIYLNFKKNKRTN